MFNDVELPIVAAAGWVATVILFQYILLFKHDSLELRYVAILVNFLFVTSIFGYAIFGGFKTNPKTSIELFFTAIAAIYMGASFAYIIAMGIFEANKARNVRIAWISCGGIFLLLTTMLVFFSSDRPFQNGASHIGVSRLE